MAAKLNKPLYRPGGLSTAGEIRRELARVYRDARQGLIDPGDGTKLAHMLSFLARLIQDTDFEARLQALEEAKDLPRDQDEPQRPFIN